MRCLITADLHYSLKQFDWLMRAAPDFDLVVLAGDHLDMFSTVDGRAQILVVSKYLERLALTTQLLVSSGNHNLDGQDNEGERRSEWIRKLRAGIPTEETASHWECPLYYLPLVGRAPRESTFGETARTRRAAGAGQMDMDLSRSPRGRADRSGVVWLSGRRRTHGLGATVPTGFRLLWACPQRALPIPRVLDRQDRQYLGVQRRTPDR